MLQVIRDRAQGVFAWIIVGMIIIPFALWGINSYFGGGGDDSVAEVDGVKISSRQVQGAYQQQVARLQQMFGGKLPEKLFSEEMLKSQVLQQLIEKELLLKAATDTGMRIGDQQLADTIKGIEVFFRDGQFNQEQYERALAQQGMSPKAFESRVRRDLVSGQLTSAVVATEFNLPGEVEQYLQLQQQQRDIGYFVLPVSKYVDGVVVSDDEIRVHYDNNNDNYLRPEQLKVEYLELNAADIASAIAVDEQEVSQRYEAQKLNFRTPEERKASHILLQTAANDSAEQQAQAEAKANALLLRIQAGESFADLAKAESQDPGSARNGGDLGFFGKGIMDKSFEEAAFALQPGEVSKVVRSAFGYHIIKLDAVRGGETKPYDEVAPQLKREIQNERAAEQFYDQAERLATLTYEQPDTLKVAAEALQLEIKTSDTFTRTGGAGLFTQPKVLEAAFSEDVLQRGNNSGMIELGDNHVVVLRVKEHLPQIVRPFDEVKSSIESALRQEKARAKALEEGAALLAKIKAGESAEAIAKAQQLEWKRQEKLQRTDSTLDQSVVRAVFRMPHLPQGQIDSTQLTLPGGDQVLVTLYGINAMDKPSADEKLRADAEQRLQRASGNAAEQALIAGLRSRAEITIKR